MSTDNDDNVTRLPHQQPSPHWIRKFSLPLPVLPEHIRKRLSTPGFWTAALAISAFTTAYGSGWLTQTRDIAVYLVLVGFVVFLSAAGMVSHAIRSSRTTRENQPASQGETDLPRRYSA
jgi:hypothetical protein